MSRYPPWISLQLRLKAPEYLAPLNRVVLPLREAFLRDHRVRFCAYESYEPHQSYYVVLDLKTGSPGELIAELRRLAESAEYRSWVEGTVAEPYHALPSEVMGGAEVADQLMEIYHHQSDACLKLFEAYAPAPPPQLLTFAMAASLLLLENLPMTAEQRLEAIRQQPKMLMERMGAKQDDGNLNQAISSLGEKEVLLRELFLGGQIHWPPLASLLEPVQIDVLEQMERRMADSLKRLTPDASRRWTKPFLDVITRRVVHPLWSRLRLDNLKEIVAFSLLDRVAA